MKHNFLLQRTVTTVVRIEVEAENDDAAYDLALELLESEDNPVDWSLGEVGHVEQTAEFD